MTKTVILHVGLPKTGTTSIQHYLRHNDQKLRSLGFLYPGRQEHPGMDSPKHLMITSAMMGEIPPRLKELSAKQGQQAVEQVFADFRKSDLESIICSHEGISTRVFGLDSEFVRRLVHNLNVRIVFSVRYVDDWIESLYMERIRAQGGAGKVRSERLKPKLKPRILQPLAPRPELPGGEAPRSKKVRSMLEEASDILRSVAEFRKVLPSTEIVVQSYDANRATGTVVSGALAAIGLPVARAFPDADEVARVHNPTKSDLYSMLILHLVMGQADRDVVRAVTTATKVRDRNAAIFEPLSGRRFRFLSEEYILEARGYYEELRDEYPHLPAQPPYAPDPAERSLPRDEGVALLDWLRPDISDAIFDSACAAYSRS